MKSIEPLGRTIMGITAWPMPGDNSSCITWRGPGACLELVLLDYARDGGFRLGEDRGAVSEPVGELATAQAMVDNLHAARAERARYLAEQRERAQARAERAWRCGGCSEALRSCACGGQTCAGLQHAKTNSHWCQDGGRAWRKRSHSRRSSGTS